MSEPKRQFYRFDNFRLDVINRQLLHAERSVPLQGKAFDLLLFLIENRGRLVQKNELLDHVWNDQFVEEANLTVQMSAIRKALGERKDAPRYILTVSGRGYRFVADVHEAAEETDELVIEKSTISRIVIKEKTDGGECKRATSNLNKTDLLQGVSQTTSNALTAILPSPMLFIVGAALFIAIIGLSFGIYQYFKQRESPVTAPRALKYTRLPIGDKVRGAVISPDGKFVAYVVNDKRIQSIWVMQIGSNNPV